MKDRNEFNWSLDVIRTYHLLSQTKSISQTAEKMGISQSAVTQKLSKLEKMLGRKLWHRRGGHPGQDSPEGNRFAEYASEILSLTDCFLEDLDLLEPTQTIRIVASTIPGEYLLPPVLALLMEKHPDVKVHIKVTDSTGVLEKLADQQAEIGFCGYAPEIQGLTSIRFASDEIVLIADETSRFGAIHDSISIQDLSGQTVIWREEGSGTRKTVESAMMQHGVLFPDTIRILEMGSTHAITQAVRQGLGVGFVSSRAIENDNVKKLRIKELPKVAREFFIVYSKVFSTRSIHHSLIKLIQEFFPV